MPEGISTQQAPRVKTGSLGISYMGVQASLTMQTTPLTNRGATSQPGLKVGLALALSTGYHFPSETVGFKWDVTTQHTHHVHLFIYFLIEFSQKIAFKNMFRVSSNGQGGWTGQKSKSYYFLKYWTVVPLFIFSISMWNILE